MSTAVSMEFSMHPINNFKTKKSSNLVQMKKKMKEKKREGEGREVEKEGRGGRESRKGDG